MLDPVLAHIKQNEPRWLADLQNWLRFPSISAQPDHASDILAAAHWAMDYLQEIGLQPELVETTGHPCVIARTPDSLCQPNAPQVLFYGHYDVQPPEPLELWESGPFEPTVRGTKLYARGACDDKGQVLCHLAALLAWKEIHGKLPCKLTLLLEGEEEIGSPNLMEVVNPRAAELRQAKTLVLSDTGQFAYGVPAITYGLRGIVGFELKLTGPAHDLHSGVSGGTVLNPGNALARIIAQLHDSQGRVTIPGFYDQVEALTPAERQEWAKLGFDEEAYRQELGAPALFGEAGFTTLERKWARPTLDINGITCGYQGPGGKTVLPSWASCKLTMRLFPGRTPRRSSNYSSNTSGPSFPRASPSSSSATPRAAPPPSPHWIAPPCRPRRTPSKSVLASAPSLSAKGAPSPSSPGSRNPSTSTPSWSASASPTTTSTPPTNALTSPASTAASAPPRPSTPNSPNASNNALGVLAVTPRKTQTTSPPPPTPPPRPPSSAQTPVPTPHDTPLRAHSSRSCGTQSPVSPPENPASAPRLCENAQSARRFSMIVGNRFSPIRCMW